MRYWITLYACLLTLICNAQNDTEVLINALMNETPIEEDLQQLCDMIGGRVTGSQANEDAVDWAIKKFRDAGIQAQKEAFEMPELWLERSTQVAISHDLNFHAQAVSKFHSPPGTYTATLVDAGTGTVEDFERLGSRAKGAFALIETELCLDIGGLFAEYAAAAVAEDNARAAGVAGLIFMASRPNKLLYRFLTKRMFDNEMPQVVVAREDAMRCQRALREGGSLEATITIDVNSSGGYTAHNVIAEIPGTDLADEIVIIGAHLDSWALGTGANDNGCNVSMMIDIARQIQNLGVKPRRTIRFALWNGEEQGFFGSHAYVRDHADELSNHVMAMSVDIGSGAIIGFFTNGWNQLVPELDDILARFDTLGPFANLPAAIVGTDNFDFMLEGIPNLVANHKPANYGLTYHSSSDTYDKVDLVSLKHNSAIVAAVVMAFANDPDLKLERMSRDDVQGIIETNDLEFTMRMFNVWEDWDSGARGRN